MNAFFQGFFDGLAGGGDIPALKGTCSGSFTYKELHERVSAYSLAITELTSKNKRVIAILSARTTANIALVLATIKSGNAYLPIDPSNPINRIFEYLTTAKPFAVIVENKVLNALQLRANLAPHAEHRLDDDYTFLILNENTSCLDQDIMQMLFTSGSTGGPKAVVHTYDSVEWFINWSVNAFQSAGGSNVLAVAPTSFDLSVFDVFFSLYTHSSLIVPSDSEVSNIRLLVSIIYQYDINLIYATPSFFNLIAEIRQARIHFAHVKHILVAGEKLTWQLIHRLKIVFPNACFYNLYGPTESNVCSYYPINFSDEEKFPDSVPIGTACSGLALELVPNVDNVCELIISGPSLFKGYLRKGILCLIGSSYASGDLVKKHDEELVFIKRSDRMIKRNGYRIEPFEIEQCIGRLPEVERVFVEQVERAGKTMLVAYVQTQFSYSKLQIKNHCLNYLPNYFLPDSVVILKDIPLNTNFKPDIGRLLENNPR